MGHTKEKEQLRMLLGKWAFDATMTTGDGPISHGSGTIEVTETALGQGFLATIEGDLEGIGRFEEVDIFSFSEEEGKVHVFSVNSMGAVHDHVGTWVSDTKLMVEWSAQLAGGNKAEKTTFEWLGPDKLVVNEVDLTSGLPEATVVYENTKIKIDEQRERLMVQPT
jgi:hypothetical protein